jgi:hypothetical protein
VDYSRWLLRPFLIDTTPPTIDIISPTDNVSYEDTQTLSYTITDDLDSDPDIAGPAIGEIYTSIGPHSILLTATDAAGNEASRLLNFTIETAAFTESQISSVVVFRPTPPSLDQLLTHQITGGATGGVYLYHPLAPIDTSAFDSVDVDAGAYEFMDSTINLPAGYDGILQLFDEIE